MKNKNEITYRVNPTIVRNLTEHMCFDDKWAMEHQNKKDCPEAVPAFFFACLMFWNMCALARIGWILDPTVTNGGGLPCFALGILTGPFFFYAAIRLFSKASDQDTLWSVIVDKSERLEKSFGLKNSASMRDDDIVGKIRRNLIDAARWLITDELKMKAMQDKVAFIAQLTGPKEFQSFRDAMVAATAVNEFAKLEAIHEEARQLIGRYLDQAKECFGPYRIDDGHGVTKFFKKAAAEIDSQVAELRREFADIR